MQNSQGKDNDTILLKQKVDLILTAYLKQIEQWNVNNDLFIKLPTFNNCILVREVKAQIGFLPYKQIWVQVVRSLNLTNDIQIQIEQALQNNHEQQQTQSIFQRKIDPSLDFIYFNKEKLEGFSMKILITGSKKVPIYGHLSRTGQIFGVQQLILPYKQITQDEQYKNVSCTAQKWLNISGFSTKQQINNPQKIKLSLERVLSRHLQSGYVFYLLKKHNFFSNQQYLQNQLMQIKQIKNRKCVFIVDIQNLLPQGIKPYIKQEICFGQHFSSHVQASIFIWEYFKQVYDEKFRNKQ